MIIWIVDKIGEKMMPHCVAVERLLFVEKKCESFELLTATEGDEPKCLDCKRLHFRSHLKTL